MAKSDIATARSLKIKKKETVTVKMTLAQFHKFKVWLADDKARKGGGLTDYKPEYCKGIVEYFRKTCEKPYDVVETVVKKKDGTPILNKAGEPIIDKVLIPRTPPYLVDYAIEIGVYVQTLLSWTTKYPLFNESVMHAKEIRTKMLVNNGLIGLYNPNSWIFAAKNLSDMTDRTDLTSKGESVFNVTLRKFTQPSEESPQGDGALPPQGLLH